MGESAEAFDYARVTFQSEYGREHSWTRQAMANYAMSLIMIGRVDECLSLYEKALDVTRKADPEGQYVHILEEKLEWARAFRESRED
jgi:hypothetical protein